MQLLGTDDVFVLNNSKVEPFTEKFGHRFIVNCESVTFRLLAPIDGDKGPLGQVIASILLIDGSSLGQLFPFTLNNEHFHLKLIWFGNEDTENELCTLQIRMLTIISLLLPRNFHINSTYFT